MWVVGLQSRKTARSPFRVMRSEVDARYNAGKAADVRLLSESLNKEKTLLCRNCDGMKMFYSTR